MPRIANRGTKVSAAFDGAGDVTGAPSSIVYLPAGKHTITATVGGKAKTVDVTVDKSVLAKLQADFEKRGERNVRAYTDFDHESKKASANPTGFRWEDGRGVVMDLDWTGAGRQSIEAKDYGYFSPTFLLGADGVPNGLPLRGPLGGLVNDPAFENIERIAAADASAELEQHQIDMESLAKCGILTENEADQENAVTVAASRVKALKGIAGDIQATLVSAAKAADIDDEALKTMGVQAAFAEGATAEAIAKAFSTILINAHAQHLEAEALKVEAADKFVEDGIRAGKVHAKNERDQKNWKRDYLEDKEEAVKAMESQPKIAAGVTERVIANKATSDSTGIEDEANELVTAGRAKTKSEAFQILMRDPAKFQAYRAATLNSQ